MTSPGQNATLPSGTVVVEFAVQDFTLGDQGETHLHYYLDSDPVPYMFYNGATQEVLYQGAHTHLSHWRSPSSIEIYALSAEPHRVRFVLANADHTELTNPEATETLDFTMLAPPTAQFDLEPMLTGLTFPLSMAFAPDGRIFFNEWQTGNIRIIDPGWVLRPQVFYQFSVLIGGERGMLGIALDPDFSNNHYVYIYHVASNPVRSRVVRLTEVNNQGTNPTVILDNIPAGEIHNGGCLQFGPDGKLYISTGEGGQLIGTSQNLSSLAGKILRLNPDGTIPADNPFAGSAVYALGLRNPYDLIFHFDTNHLWLTDNGPDTNDEVNRIIAGGNYGWPNALGVRNDPRYIDPLATFTPTIAPTGIVAIRPNSVYPSDYNLNVLFAEFKNGKIYRLVLGGSNMEEVSSVSIAYNGGQGGVLDMVQASDGYVYVTTKTGIYRLVFRGNLPPAAGAATPASGSGLSQTFSFAYSDGNGYPDLARTDVLINRTLDLANSCYVRYEKASNSFFLRNDPSSAWPGPLNVGSSGILQNSQCSLDGGGSSVTASGNDVTLTLALAFKKSFVGLRPMHLAAEDSTGAGTGWQERGSWTVPNEAPAVVAVSPGSGTGRSQTFSFSFSDPNSSADLAWVQMLINGTLTFPSSCYMHYNPTFNVLYLMDNAASRWLGPVALGGGTTLQNSQCQVDAPRSSAVKSGDTITVDLAVNFQAPFSGTKTVYMQTKDYGGMATGWVTQGSWIVPPSQPPAVVSVTPASGSGLDQPFSFLFSDPDGWADLSWVEMLINSSLNFAAGCYTHYNPTSNMLLLRNDAGNGWVGPVALGTSGSLQNSQCVVNAGASVASKSGNNLTVTLALSFKPTFAGSKAVYMQALDKANLNASWQGRGSWTVPFGTNLPPAAVSVAPNSGSGSTQIFTFLYSDPNGATDLPWTEMLINSGLSSVNACYIRYDRAFNVLYLRDNASTSWLGPASLGLSTTLENGQCTVNAANSAANSSGNDLTIGVEIAFKSTFGGNKITYMRTQDGGGQATGWQSRGSWTVLPAVNQAPSAVSATPSSGSGLGQTFSFLFSDPNGYGDLAWVQMSINSALSFVAGCYMNYNPASNAVMLRNDANTAWLGPFPIGAAATLENSQCAINMAASSVNRWGTNLSVNLPISFKPGFAGTRAVYLQTKDTGGLATGWQGRGSWSVPFSSNQAPSAVSVTPASGTGATRTFSFVYSDPNGAADLPWAEMLFNTSTAAANACYLRYDRAFNVVYLRNDAGSGWIGPVSPGLPSTLQNSQCMVDAAGSSSIASATNLTLNLALTFKPAFAGAKTVYMQTQDGSGVATGWLSRGSWTAP